MLRRKESKKTTSHGSNRGKMKIRIGKKKRKQDEELRRLKKTEAKANTAVKNGDSDTKTPYDSI